MTHSRTAGKIASAATLILVAGLTFCCVEEVRGQETDAGTRAYATAVRLQNLESYDLAAEAWRKFSGDFPDDPRQSKAKHYLGVCQFQLGQFTEAGKTLEQVLNEDPKMPMLDATLLYLGVTQYTLAQDGGKPNLYDQAVKTLGRLIEKHDQSKYVGEAFFYRGECFYHQGRREEAAAEYGQLVEKQPDHRLAPDALYAMGVAREENEQPTEALEAYTTFLERFAKSDLTVEVRMRQADAMFALGRFDEAIEGYAATAASKGFALADYATIRQADASAHQKRFVEAAALYDQVTKQFPKSDYVARARLAGGRCYFLADEFPKALTLLEPIVQSGGPGATEAAHWTAQALLKQGQVEAVLQRIQPVLAKLSAEDPFAARLLLDRADATYEIKGSREKSIGLYASVAEAHPDDPVAPQACYMAGFAALEAGQYEAAVTHADRFVQRWPDDPLKPDVLHVGAESRLLLGRHGEAQPRFDTLLKQYPNHAESELWRVRRGLALFLQGKHEETVAALSSDLGKIRRKPLVAEAQYLIGASQFELGEHEAAGGALEASVAADTKWRQADEAMLTLARTYRGRDNVEGAITTIQRLVKQFPKSPLLDRAHYRWGECLYVSGDHAGSAEHYGKVLDNWPNSPLVPHALHELGCAELNAGQPEASDKSLSRLIDEFGEHALVARARYGRAMARHKTGNAAGAIEDLNVALAANDPDVSKTDARYVLGLCQLSLDDHAAAIKTFETLLDEDPKHAGADNATYQLAWAHKLSGNGERAVELFGKLAEEFEDSSRAGEALYHVAEQAYAEKDYPTAAVKYYYAVKKAGKGPVAEKAGHKLGWTYYQQGDFDRAAVTFAAQQHHYAEGVLSGDAAFMEAECLFRQDKFAEALAKYESLGKMTNPKFQVLALLHAGQSASQLKQWPKALERFQACVADHPDSAYVPEALYEQGWAWQNLDKPDEAIASYEQVIAKSEREVAARAQFMIGEIQFEKKDHSEAIKSFFKVLYGYSYPKWQAEAAFEAARCFEVLEKPTQAVKLYRELVTKFPESEKVTTAQARIRDMGG